MKRAVLAAALAIGVAPVPMHAFAQTVANQCFAIGDIAGQVASWRRHKKTKEEALAQAQKYYKDASDRQAVMAVIERLYEGPALTPDQASMLITQDCAQQHKATGSQ